MPDLAPRPEGNLSRAKRDVVARWALKTACTLNLGSNYRKVIPPEHARAVANSASLPREMIVVGQRHINNEPFYWLQGGIWIFDSRKDRADAKATARRLDKEGFKTTFQLGSLLLTIAYAPGGWLFVLQRRVHCVLGAGPTQRSSIPSTKLRGYLNGDPSKQ